VTTGRERFSPRVPEKKSNATLVVLDRRQPSSLSLSLTWSPEALVADATRREKANEQEQRDQDHAHSRDDDDR